MGRIPERTCIGCRRACPAAEMVRIVAPEGRLAVLPRRGVAARRGRGAWIHPRGACVAAAVKSRAFGRAFRREVDVVEPVGLTERIRQVFGISSHEQGDP